jgi:GrpB-like predicted nucleotidyltransferase (UPF0157 family)
MPSESLRRVEIHNYDPEWPRVFEHLRDGIAAAVGPQVLRIEHVGSTSVAGLAAKPIVDLILVIATHDDLEVVIDRLRKLGYQHRGDLGIAGREAFTTPQRTTAHHLYVCAEDSTALRRMLGFRDILRSDTSTARAYAALKHSLAERFRDNRPAYTEAKTSFIDDILDNH